LVKIAIQTVLGQGYTLACLGSGVRRSDGL